jgi:type I restriction enzyme M protein
MVLPDSCLFVDKASEVLEHMTKECDLHTVLRLPHGTFSPYSNGVRANVLFFSKGVPTRRTWIYDARTGTPTVTKKERPLTQDRFAEFEKCYGEDPNGRSRRRASDSPEHRWKSFRIEETKDAGYKFDSFSWLQDTTSTAGTDTPEAIALRILQQLKRATAETARVLESLAGSSNETTP